MNNEYHKLMRECLDTKGKHKEARKAALMDITIYLKEQGFNLTNKEEVWHVNRKTIMSKPLRLKVYNIFNDYQKVNFWTL